MPISQSKPESQPEPDHCQVCAQPLPATGAGEVCPACLVADALAPMDSLDGESLDQAPAERTSSLFADGFESGNFTVGGWTTPNGNAPVRGSAAFSGSNGAELQRSASIQKTLSTVGYHSITVSYARRTQRYDNGEVLSIQWWNGSIWQDVEPPTQNTTYTSVQFALDASAANNANFAIRFLTNANANNEKAGIDVVEVTGIAGSAN